MKNQCQIRAGFAVLIAILATSRLSVAAADPDKDPRYPGLVAKAQQLALQHKTIAAIDLSEKVISAFKAYYGKERRKIYCANTSAEGLGNLLEAAVKKQNAMVLSPTWANAYFIEGYCLQDLHRFTEAKKAIAQAIALSPTNSHYLCEMGEIFQIEKNWAKAEEEFQSAEDHASLAPDETRADDLARARRGLGYVYVELGQLAKAEKKYRQCLATNPKDTRARDELRYVQQLRTKQSR